MSRLEGVRGHRSGALYDVDLTSRGSIPTVTAARALVDVSGRVTSKELGYVVDDALRRRLLSLEEPTALCGAVGTRAGPLAEGMQRVLGDRLPGYSPGDSDLETRAPCAALTRAGLPPPRQQYRMQFSPGGRYGSTWPTRSNASPSSSTVGTRIGSAPRSTPTMPVGTTFSSPSGHPLTFTSAMTDEYLVSTVGHLYRRAPRHVRAIAGGIVRLSRERSGGASGKRSAAAFAGGGRRAAPRRDRGRWRSTACPTASARARPRGHRRSTADALTVVRPFASRLSTAICASA